MRLRAMDTEPMGSRYGTARRSPLGLGGTVAVHGALIGAFLLIPKEAITPFLPAPPIGSDPGLVTGTVILGTDTPALVLDPDGLIDRLGRAGPRAARPAARGGEDGSGTIQEKRRSTILVVDDSITTRTLEKSILEAAGYRVIVCVDGQEALDRLRARIEPVDLVVADVEMPRLTGFGLVEALRAEADFARLPIVLMTSRGDEEDVARGLELGADAYLTKQKFDQRELLDTIGQLL